MPAIGIGLDLSVTGNYPIGGTNLLVYDTFTDVDATNLTAHTPEIGGTWVQLGSRQPRIYGNVCRLYSANTHAAYMETGVTDVKIEADFHLGGNYPELVFKVVDSTHYYIFRAHANGSIYFARYSNGSTMIDGKAIGLVTDGDYHAVITAVGDTFRADITGDTTNYLQVTDSETPFAGTKHGVGGYGDAAEPFSTWDNFTVTPL